MKAYLAFIAVVSFVSAMIISTVGYTATLEDDLRVASPPVIVVKFTRCPGEVMWMVLGVVAPGLSAATGLPRGWNGLIASDESNSVEMVRSWFPYSKILHVENKLECES